MTITKDGVHPSTHAQKKVHDPGHKGASGDNEKLPASAPHLHEKKESAPKSGKYGEVKATMAGHNEAAKTESPVASGPKSAAQTMYPKKLGLRGKVE